ncbi:MAG: hypothetical protein P8M11_13630 [Planctomycetota bacterium]|nr:hypothetical protein [Planctomycetota bacterium]
MTCPLRHLPLLPVVLVAALSGCFLDTQKYPGMLTPETVPLPDGAKTAFGRGAEEAFVIRHSDPVRVRLAESNSVYDLSFYEKRTLIPAGSWVFAGPEGYAEVLLPGDTQVALHGRGTGVIGSESRREPVFTLLDVTAASIRFGETGRVQLPGGAILEASSGPFSVETIHDRLIRVRNRSNQVGRVDYRDEVIRLEPSETVELALLSDFSTPFEVDPSTRAVESPAGRIALRGQVEVLSSGAGTVLRATGTSEVEGLGLRLQLSPGDEVRLEALGGNGSDL